MGLADGLGHVWPLSMTSESSQAPCLRCCSAVAWSTGSRGVADAMIEANFPNRQLPFFVVLLFINF